MLSGTHISKHASGPFLDEVELDFEDRHRRRAVFKGKRGHEFLLDLPEVPDLREGDAVVLTTGEMIRVCAASEALMEIHCNDAIHLARIAWHIGNRHLPAEIYGGGLRVRVDHVIAAMVEGLHGHVHVVSAPFNPEGGAYGQDRVMGHDDHHGTHHLGRHHHG